jgi:hypothetical protein
LYKLKEKTASERETFSKQLTPVSSGLAFTANGDPASVNNLSLQTAKFQAFDGSETVESLKKMNIQQALEITRIQAELDATKRACQVYSVTRLSIF